MSQFDDDDDFDDNDNINVVRKADRAKAKRISELEKELSSFRTSARKQALQGAIEAKGLNPKIAAFVPADLSPDEVGDWLTEYGDVFAPSGAAPVVDDAPQELPTGITPEGAAAFSEVANSGAAPTGDEGQLLARIKAAKTPEELNQILGIV